jgi:release factor glutamine methyltransferase
MKKLVDVIQTATDYLKNKKVSSPRRSVEKLFSHALKMNRTDLYLNFDKPLQDSELTVLRELVKRRAVHEPVEYIIGKISFYGLDLDVNPDVLIPRPETEILIEKIIQKLDTVATEDLILWDVGTGSGAIGLAMKKAFPKMQVVLSDLSDKALAVAKKNAEKNNIEVTFLQGDLLLPFSGQKADIIVSNPPYISEKDYENLSLEVKDFEPKGALLGGNSGFEYYQRLARDLPIFLKAGGLCFFEIGTGQGEGLCQIFSSYKTKVEKDWAGHDRFFSLENQ